MKELLSLCCVSNALEAGSFVPNVLRIDNRMEGLPMETYLIELCIRASTSSICRSDRPIEKARTQLTTCLSYRSSSFYFVLTTSSLQTCHLYNHHGFKECPAVLESRFGAIKIAERPICSSDPDRVLLLNKAVAVVLATEWFVAMASISPNFRRCWEVMFQAFLKRLNRVSRSSNWRQSAGLCFSLGYIRFKQCGIAKLYRAKG